MAGTDPRFDRDRVNAGLLLAQNMGMPVDPADQPRFHFAQTIEYEAAATTGAPWSYIGNPDAEVSNGRQPIVATCGRKALDIAPDQTIIGQMTVLRYELTLLPDAWAKVHDFVHVVIGGYVYRRQGKQPPPSALFNYPIRRVRVVTGDV